MNNTTRALKYLLWGHLGIWLLVFVAIPLSVPQSSRAAVNSVLIWGQLIGALLLCALAVVLFMERADIGRLKSALIPLCIGALGALVDTVGLMAFLFLNIRFMFGVATGGFILYLIGGFLTIAVVNKTERIATHPRYTRKE